MMIVLRNADITDGAVLTAGRLETKAGTASLARVEEDTVIRVLSHVGSMRRGGDDGGSGADGQEG